MEEDARDGSGQNLLRPLSTPNLASRFPSLRRINSTEPYKHRSLPPENPPNDGSDRASSEITFAVLYDDGPDYHVGHYDREGSIHSNTHRPDSATSFAPSFRTRDSRVPSDDHEFVANQRLLAEGYLNNQDTSYNPHRGFNTQSETTLAMNTLHNSYSPNEKRTSYQTGQQQSQHSRESWCTCDEDHGPGMQQQPDPQKVDLEKGPPTPTPLLGGEKNNDPYKVSRANMVLTISMLTPPQVDFKGPTDPLNPKNWPNKDKWAATIITASFTFVSPLASSMIAPALGQLAREFNTSDGVETQMMLSIFVLAYAIGPMFLGPLSELYGRSIVLQLSNLVFMGFNLACGFAQSKEQLLAFRFLSGIGGSAPLAIGGGVLGDLFKPEERGKAMGIYAMGPLLGPAVGPIVGSWVAEYSSWRWIFWSSSAADFVIAVFGVWKLKETYAPYILHKKAKAIRKQTGNDQYRAADEGAVDQPIWKKVASTMGRSFKMLFTQPIVQAMSVYMAFSYGILYLALSTMPRLFHGPRPQGYGQGLGISGLHYIALGLGFFFGAPICGKTSDKAYAYFKKKNPTGQGKPEFRMPVVIPFSFFVPIGLVIYGWSAQNLTHWIVPDIGLFLFGMGTIAAFQCVTSYLVDTYARFAASAVAAVTILRSLAGFTFPLFAPAMFRALGQGWGNTVLAFAALGIGIPVPILLWLFGEKLRKRSSMAMKRPPGGPGGPGGGGPPGGGGGPPGKGPGGGPPGGGPGMKGGPPPQSSKPDVGRAPSGPQGPPPPFEEGRRRGPRIS